MSTNQFLRALLISLTLMIVPLSAYILSSDFHWDIVDFIVAFVLIGGFLLSLQWVRNRFKSPIAQFLIPSLMFLLFALLWADLAVGLFDLPWSGN